METTTEIKPMSKAQCVRVIDAVYWAIDRVINSNQHRDAHTREQRRMSYGLQDKWRALLEECGRQEKEHRAFGRRLHQSLRGRVSVPVAARYFAAMAVCRDVPELKSWTDADDIRSDWRIGYRLGETFAALGLWSQVRKHLESSTATSPDMIDRLKAIDYARDLA